jgi:hypothetical protein
MAIDAVDHVQESDAQRQHTLLDRGGTSRPTEAS